MTELPQLQSPLLFLLTMLNVGGVTLALISLARAMIHYRSWRKPTSLMIGAVLITLYMVLEIFWIADMQVDVIGTAREVPWRLLHLIMAGYVIVVSNEQMGRSIDLKKGIRHV